jgi:uncharacterized RDD family membrane protein YckC
MKGGGVVNVPARDAGYVSGNAERGALSRYQRFSKVPIHADVQMRLLATAFDLMLVGVLIVFALLLAGDTWQVGVGSWLSAPDITVLVACVPFLYFVGFWCFSASSPGKMLLSLHIVDVDTYMPLTGGQCLMRYVGYLLDVCALGLGVLGMFDKHCPQGWHDKLARTIVVQQ